MSWVTFVWALVVGACVIMALPHLLIGARIRAWANLFFVLAALSVAGIAFGELAIMHSETTGEIGRAMRWTHLPIFFIYPGIVGFILAYFGTGRRWLGIATVGLRLVSLIINFAIPPNLNFREITSLRHLHFLGDTIAGPQGVYSPWTRLGELGNLLLLAFVIDASITFWRRGGPEGRRRAAVVGGSITLFIVLAVGKSPCRVAVLDVWMPDMNGLEVQSVMRRDSPETRIIFMSGRDDPSVRQTALEAGAVGFLSKPFDDEIFLQLVRKAVTN